MFETLPQFSLEMAVIVGRAMLLVGAFWVFALAFTRWRRADERNAERLHEQLTRAFQELRSLHETVTVMSARIDSLSEHAEGEARRAPIASGNQRGYDVAARMAKNGADVDSLVASCGVTRHEAELLVRLHGARHRETPPPAWPAASSTQDPLVRRAASSGDHSADVAWCAQDREAPAPQPQASAARKRGSLLSVVG